ncbi:MAG: GNAT family protein [Pseudomonadota bacterium]
MADFTPLSTERFQLRALQPSDAAALFPTLSDPKQCRYLTRPAFASEEELWGWLADPSWPGRTWIAVNREGPNAGEVAGRFTAHTAHQEDVEEIGYIVCADRQKDGVARECVETLVDYLFNAGVRKLTAEVDTRNVGSVRLLERLGFTREGHFREHEETHVGMCDVYWYGRLSSEYFLDK